MQFAELRDRFQRQMAAYATDVGRRLREARERNRPELSQEGAAHELGVSVRQYGRWERGESEPRGRQWEPLAKMLRVSVDDLRGKPPIAPEEELRDQLDRMESMLNAIIARLDLAATLPPQDAPEVPEEEPTRRTTRRRAGARRQAP